MCAHVRLWWCLGCDGICFAILSAWRGKRGVRLLRSSAGVRESWDAEHRRADRCCCSVSESCLTLCDPMDHGAPGFPVLHYPLESAQGHVH